MVATLNCNVDGNVKEQAKAVYANWGIDLTTAVNVFLRKSIECGGFPFDVRPKEPNAETIAALLEAKALSKDPKAKTFHSLQELMDDWEV
ncbi:MAG: type II toxin-antitoxin system RelB/DinJ family antitoxin [Clostridia bacterium]|nr:type II toxin-antitoxin system RelB/DinJ family antitoxin [Clostridia bacterium]